MRIVSLANTRKQQVRYTRQVDGSLSHLSIDGKGRTRTAQIRCLGPDWYRVSALVQGCAEYVGYPDSLRSAKREVDWYFAMPEGRGWNV